ncbi:MAG: sugar kinase [Candidatus Marinimicrobia bacterium]|nr:sugar kinase [Candidatus Neomarinimicrobiota bacterium]
MKTSNPILTVGSIALDNLETIHESRERVIGGSTTYFAMAASQFTEVRIVGVVGTDFTDDGHAIFNSKNIDTKNLQIEEGETFGWGGKYSPDFSSRETTFTNLGVFKHFNPIIHSEHTHTPIVFLGNIHPDLQLNVINQMQGDTLFITDTMNLWIDISLDQLWEVIQNTHIFLLNDEEAEQLTGTSDLKKASEILLSKGPETVIIKKGSKGSMVAGKENLDNIPVFPGVNLVDPTGAGDSFAGGFCGYIAKYGKTNLIDAIIYGSAVASFTVSQFSVDGLRNITMNDIENRANIISKLLTENIII